MSVPVPAARFTSLSRPLRLFFLATVVNMLGSGALFGFVLIYFHEVRGLSLGQAGAAVAAESLTIVGLTPSAGWMSDRFGARRTLAIGCVVSIAAGVSYAFVASFGAALAVSVLLGIGTALWYPAQSALLALIVTAEMRPAVSAFQRTALNLGAALGGLVGGFVVRDGSLASFRVLFGLNVTTYVVFLGVLTAMPSGRVGMTHRRPGEPAGFRTIFADRFFLNLLVSDVAIALGFGFLWAFTPAYASQRGVSKATIGALFAAGAVTVTVAQVPTLRLVSGRDRMRCLAVMDAWFALAFALLLATTRSGPGVLVAALVLSQVLGGFGEALLGAVRQPLTADLAPSALVGRYYGLATLVFQGCMGLANALGGVVMEHSLVAVWAIPFAVSLAGVGGSLVLRRRIPRHLLLSP